MSALDVGHGIDPTYGQKTGPYDDLTDEKNEQLEIEYAQDFIGRLLAGLTWPQGLPEIDDLSKAALIFEKEALIEHMTALLQAPTAVRDVLGYSGVSDQACGADTSMINGEIEDGNSGVHLC